MQTAQIHNEPDSKTSGLLCSGLNEFGLNLVRDKVFPLHFNYATRDFDTIFVLWVVMQCFAVCGSYVSIYVSPSTQQIEVIVSLKRW